MASTSLDLHCQPGDPAHHVLTVFLDGCEHSATEIAALTGLSVAEAARWATTLADLRLLDRDQDQSYRPGAALRINARSTGAASSGADFPDRLDILRELTAIVGGPARIGVLHHDRVSYLRSAMMSSEPVQRDLIGLGAAGSLTARHSELQQSALGQVLLAYARDGVTRGFLGRVPALAGPAGAGERHELDLSLAVVRLSGVAMTRGESSTLDVAVPVFGPDGQVDVALEICTGGFREADAAVLDPLRRIAQRLSG